MSGTALPHAADSHRHVHARHPHAGRPNLDAGTHFYGVIIFIGLLMIGLGFTIRGLVGDISAVGTPPLAIGAFILLVLNLPQ